MTDAHLLVCADCECVFESPVPVVERHGLDTPPYEVYDACPLCYGSCLAEAFECEGCGEIVTGQYVQLESGERYCDCCFTIRNLLD